MRPLKASHEGELLHELRKRLRVKRCSHRDQVLQGLIPDTLAAAHRYDGLVGGEVSTKECRQNITALMLAKYDREDMHPDKPTTGFIFEVIASTLLSMFIKKVVRLLLDWYRRRGQV